MDSKAMYMNMVTEYASVAFISEICVMNNQRGFTQLSKHHMKKKRNRTKNKNNNRIADSITINHHHQCTVHFVILFFLVCKTQMP